MSSGVGSPETDESTGAAAIASFAPTTTPAVVPGGRLTRKQRQRLEDAHRVGAALNMLEHQGVRVLHDRFMPGSDGTIEHVVIGNDGVTVVRSARLMGRVRSTKSELFIGGANATVLVTGLQSRVNTVRHLVGGEAEVHGAFALTRRRRDMLKFHGRIAIGSPRALVDYLEQVHNDSPETADLTHLAEALEGIFLPTTSLS